MDVDARERLREERVLLGEQQLFLLLFAHLVGRVQRGVDFIEAAEVGNQLERAFLADARHAGDVVGLVAHDGFDIHKLLGRHAVMPDERRAVEVDRLGIRRQQHRDVVPNQLERVAVAGEDVGVLARVCCGVCQRADEVVRLKALLFDNGEAHGAQHLLGGGKLLEQFGRRRAATRLVVGVHLVAEGRRLQIKGDGGIGGVQGAEMLFDDVQHPVDGVGVQPLARGERAHAEIGAVDDAVSVNDKQLFHLSVLLGKCHRAEAHRLVQPDGEDENVVIQI